MSNFTLIKKNPTQGEITSSLTGSTGDGAGLHFADNGYIDVANNAAAEFGTADFSIEFVLNQTGDNTSDNYIYTSHVPGNNRFYIWNDISDNKLNLLFSDGSGSATTKVLDYDMSADYGTPTHYVLTFDRDANATLYKNGNSVATVDISSTASIDIGSGNANAGRLSASTGYGVLGTFYRFRLWNKLADAKALFERSDVDYADQYGSQTNKISAAVDKNWGTNQADSGNDANDRATFNANYAWTVNGTSVVDISVASNVLTFSARYNKHGIYYNASLVAGKRQRITLNVTTVGTGEFGLYYYTGSAYALITTLVAGENSVEFVPTATNGYVYLGCTEDHASAKQIVLNAASIANSIVLCGCVSDYDLAFANPTQSLTVQDRAGTADGTCSASGVTQVQPVVQLNSTAARIGTTAATPADGQILTSGDIGVGGSPNTTASTSTIEAVNSGTARVLMKSTGTGGREYGLWTSTSGNLGFFDYTAGANRLSIDSSGNVTVDGGDLKLKAPAGNQTDAELLFSSPNNNSYGSTFAIDSKILSTANQSDNPYGSKLKFYTSDNSDTVTERLTIDSSGRVGVGNSAPAAPLEVSKSAASTESVISTFSTPDGDHSILNFKKSGSAAIGTKAVTADGEVLGSIGAYGVDTNSDQRRSAQIEFSQAAASTGSKVAGKIVFKTSSTSANDVTALTIASGGHVSMTSSDSAAQLTITPTGTNANGIVNFIPPGTGRAILQYGGTEALSFNNTGVTFANGINLGHENLTKYDEGSFTPTIAAETGTINGTNIEGRYTRIGNVCHVWFSIECTGVSGASGAVEFGSFPFTSQGPASSFNTPMVVRYISLGSAVESLVLRLFNNSTGGRIEEQNGTSVTNLADNVQNGTVFQCAGAYRLASG